MDLPNYNCVLFNANVEETAYHLFTSCSFSTQCYGLINLHTEVNLSPLQNLELLRTKQINKPFFMEIIILMC